MYGMVTSCRLVRSCPERRRDHILDVARDVFLEEGYGATSMSGIAARLGGSKATLYKYFPSKERLFEDMMTNSCTLFLDSLREAADAADDAETLLRSLGEKYLRGLLEPQAVKINRLVHAEGFRFPEVAATWFRTGPDVTRELLVERLEAFATRGDIRCADLRLTVEQFLGMVRGDLLMRVVCCVDPVPDDARIRFQVDAATRAIMDGLRAERG